MTTMTTDRYLDQVLAHLPPTTPTRAQIALELRGHIEERLAAGQPLPEVLEQLGDPATLAESYLAGVPMALPGFGARLIAKVIDVAAAAPDIEIVQAVGIEFTADGKRAFVALGRGSKVVEIDPATYRIVRFFPVGFRAWSLALSPDETRLYTANGLTGDLTVIDLVANRVAGTVALGGKPWGVVAAP